MTFDLDDLDLSKNEPLKLISGAALHLPSKFGEDRPKDLGGVGEQTNKQTDKLCSNYSMITVAVLLTVLTAHTSPIYATTTTAVFTDTSLPASSVAVRASTTTAVPVTTTTTTAVPSTTVTTAAPSTAKYVCEDLNTDACRQLNASKQGYCNDVALSKPICPRFCGHCRK